MNSSSCLVNEENKIQRCSELLYKDTESVNCKGEIFLVFFF